MPCRAMRCPTACPCGSTTPPPTNPTRSSSAVGKLPPSAIEVPNPIIVVEVLSKSTRGVDLGEKLPGYFAVPSVMHYLIVDPDRPLLIHHSRTDGDALATRIVRDGAIELAPPGITLELADLYAP